MEQYNNVRYKALDKGIRGNNEFYLGELSFVRDVPTELVLRVPYIFCLKYIALYS